jgi:PAS domain S-box-containing protein
MTILVVDDFAVNRKVVNAFLSHEGFRVLEASDGIEALRILEREPIDAVISDILMPNMDGYRLCMELRRSAKFSGVPFVLYNSAYTSPGDEALALELGADAFIRKPAPDQVIVDTLRGLVSGPRRSHPVVKPRADMTLRSEYLQRLVAALEETNEKLRESEDRFVAFMNNQPIFAWIKDLEGRMVWMNNMTERLSEYGSRQGKSDADLFPAEMAAQYYATDQKVITGGKPIRVVEPFVMEGETHYALCSKFPIFDKTGAVVMVGGSALDITDRIQAEEALRESEERFRQMAENINEVFFLRNVKSACMEFISGAYERIFKRSVESLRHEFNSWIDAIHPEDREQATHEVERMRTTGENDFTYRILWPDGAIRWIRTRAFPIRDAQGDLIRIAGFCEDITEWKVAKQKSEKLAEMLHVLTNWLFDFQEEERRQIARELHDEIGQSLTAAKLEIEAAKKMTDPEARALRLDDGLAVIEQLLQSVRTLSLDLRPALLDEVGLAAALCAHVQSQAARGGLALRLAVDESLPRCEPAIEIACFRVAQEALTNVLRHARAKSVEVELRRRGDELHLLVRDDGAGFDAAEADARATRGATLGLLSMRERANLAGGRFVCKSNAGQGTEIDVHLPFRVVRVEDRHEKSARYFGG